MIRTIAITTLLALAGFVLVACVRTRVHGDAEDWVRRMKADGPQALRVATYNTSLYAETSGGLVARLEAGDPAAAKIAAVLQRTRPDVVLLNEFDYDAGGRAADLFQQRYLGVAQPGGGDALHYPYRYFAPVNTGVSSGLDLDRNGVVGGEGREAGNDAWGYGLHPGQYGMLLLSRHPIDERAVRTFQLLKWSVMPGARTPRDPVTGEAWYPPEVWSQLRLSSKSHWDVPVNTPYGRLHVLAAHPTPPVFDGPEDRNGARNADEIRLWAEYITPGAKPWLCDDQGRCGGLPAGEQFVIMGDYNADPSDGDSVPGAIAQLLSLPRVNAAFVPRSTGAADRAAMRAIPRQGDVTAHTGDFGPRSGTLRLDYVLPSAGLPVRGGGVFWPREAEPGAGIIDASDHHLVWLDLGAP